MGPPMIPESNKGWKQKKGSLGNMMRVYENYASHDLCVTNPMNPRQQRCFERQRHNIAMPYKETGVRSSLQEAYIVSCPITWKNEHCKKSKSTQ